MPGPEPASPRARRRGVPLRQGEEIQPVELDEERHPSGHSERLPRKGPQRRHHHARAAVRLRGPRRLRPGPGERALREILLLQAAYLLLLLRRPERHREPRPGEARGPPVPRRLRRGLARSRRRHLRPAEGRHPRRPKGGGGPPKNPVRPPGSRGHPEPPLRDEPAVGGPRPRPQARREQTDDLRRNRLDLPQGPGSLRRLRPRRDHPVPRPELLLRNGPPGGRPVARPRQVRPKGLPLRTELLLLQLPPALPLQDRVPRHDGRRAHLARMAGIRAPDLPPRRRRPGSPLPSGPLRLREAEDRTRKVQPPAARRLRDLPAGRARKGQDRQDLPQVPPRHRQTLRLRLDAVRPGLPRRKSPAGLRPSIQVVRGPDLRPRRRPPRRPPTLRPDAPGERRQGQAPHHRQPEHVRDLRLLPQGNRGLQTRLHPLPRTPQPLRRVPGPLQSQ
mmetsp:Transcript_3011/g.10027  ORF Transcript_3011/g.10027 Transcript_3011/m.10027 type:complete len:447 (-) Transcript_3011:225-1565(-)